jgi:hypothetical protein
MRDSRSRVATSSFAALTVERLEDRAQPALLAPLVPALAPPDLADAVVVRVEAPAPAAIPVRAAPAAPAEPPGEPASPWAWTAAVIGGLSAVWTAWECYSASQAPAVRSWRECLLGLDLDRS